MPGAPRVVRPLRLGYTVSDDASVFLAAAGVGADFGDVRGSMEAVVRDTNRRGGVLGGDVELVPYTVETARAVQDPAVAAQEACDSLAHDERVDVVVSTVAPINIQVLFRCLSRAGIPVVLLDPNPHSLRDELERFPGFVYHPATVATERLAPVWVDRLAALGWFGGWDVDGGAPAATAARTGVLYQSGNETFLESLTRALRARGQRAPETIEYTSFQDAAEKMPAFTFQLKQRGVTHVLVDKPVTLNLFMKAARSQGYYPRYGITTNHGPSVAVAEEAEPAQLRGAAGVGFLPMADVPEAGRFSSYRAAGSPARRCDALHAREAVRAKSQLALTYQRLQCDAVWLLDEAYTAGGRLTAEALRRGLAARTSTTPGAAAESIAFGPQRYDGAAAVRDLRYDSARQRFVYGTARIPLR